MILTLDIAAKAGFAHGLVGESPSFGSISFGGDGVPVGQTLDDFDEWLWDKIEELAPTHIYRELPFISPHINANTVQILYGMAAMVIRACYRQRIIGRSVTPMEANKFFVGKQPALRTGPGESTRQFKERRRVAKKAATVRACKMRGHDVTDDDQADALALWYFAQHDIRVGSRPLVIPEASIRQQR